jgi:hypothetical protein
MPPIAVDVRFIVYVVGLVAMLIEDDLSLSDSNSGSRVASSVWKMPR